MEVTINIRRSRKIQKNPENGRKSRTLMKRAGGSEAPRGPRRPQENKEVQDPGDLGNPINPRNKEI
jgi:hypothetical protein